MNEIKIFQNEEFGQVRTLTINGEPWFVGKDVAEALGYADTKDAIKKHVDQEDKQLIQKGQIAALEIPNRGMTIINESGLYSLILSSKLPSAKKFKRWVTSEVLPALRRTGTYTMEKQDSYMIENPAARARRWAEEYEEKQLLEQKNEVLAKQNDKLQNENNVLKPKGEFYDQVGDFKGLISVSKMAALLKNDEFKITQNILFEYLRQKKMLCSASHVYNKPSQEMLDKGYMEYKTYIKTSYNKNVYRTVSFTPQITGAGQRYIYEHVMKNKEFFKNMTKK